jgi:hypothetical protein
VGDDAIETAFNQYNLNNSDSLDIHNAVLAFEKIKSIYIKVKASEKFHVSSERLHKSTSSSSIKHKNNKSSHDLHKEHTNNSLPKTCSFANSYEKLNNQYHNQSDNHNNHCTSSSSLQHHLNDKKHLCEHCIANPIHLFLMYDQTGGNKVTLEGNFFQTLSIFVRYFI